MTSVKQWAAIVCISALIACLTDMLSPSGRMDKTIRLVLGMFMLCAVFIPFANTALNLSTGLGKIQSTDIPDNFQQSVHDNFSGQACAQIETLARDLLAKNNENYKKVEVLMDINQDFSISIIRINVELDRQYLARGSAVKSLLEENLGIETNIEFS